MESLGAADKYQKLLDIIRARGSVAVAFSGGVDSSFLCYAAREAVRDNAVAITIVSPMLPKSEMEWAKIIAEKTGITHIFVEEKNIDAQVAANPKDRCYYCKKIEFGKIIAEAKRRGINTVLDGSNMDDLSDYRPGLRAISELQVCSPLREAELNKSEIRALSKEAGLPTWDKPAFACLASRVPYGEKIDAEKLSAIEAAESYLRERGFVQFRVRSHGNTQRVARIEVAPDERKKFFDEKLLDEASAKLKSLGFAFVAFEAAGYRMGSMNA
jgi:uncharacterized protein